jgi:integrase
MKIHDSDHSYELGKRNIKQDKQLSHRNKKLILDLGEYLLAKGTSKVRVRTVYFPKLKYICKTIHKDLDKYTKNDVARVMSQIESSSYSQGTKNHYVTVFKVFYRWLHNLNPEDSPPKIVSWLRNHKTHPRIKKEDLLTMKELRLMIQATTDPMWKALVACLWETAARPGEIRSIQLKDIHIQPNKIKIYVRGKTKKKLGDRPVFVYKHYHLLTTWLSLHPNSSNPKSPLFSLDGRKPITNAHLLKQISRLGMKANPSKRVYPYLLRHTRLTELYPKLGHLITQKFAGHSDNSKMISTYFHMNEDDLETSLDEQEGLDPKKPKSQLECQRCHKPISLDAEVCPHCNLIFTIQAAVKHESTPIPKEVQEAVDFYKLIKQTPLFQKLIQTPEFQGDLLNAHFKHQMKKIFQ